jgi:scyllo-inositol 2-dehydrogenase (NADP+)
MTADQPVRAAIVGFGHAGAEIHHPIMVGTGVEPVAVVATSDRARARATERGLAAVGSIEDLSAIDVDVIVIAVPDVAHEEFALRAAELAPQALVIDKPLATTSAGAARIIDACTPRGTTVVPFQNRRWDGDFLTLKQLNEDGVLGEIIRVESRISRWAPVAGGAGWRDRANEGLNGQLGGNGSHLVDQMLVLLGPVDSVYGEIRTVRSADGPNDDVFIALHHRSGISSHLLMSSVAAGALPRFTAYGLRGTYSVDGMDPQQDRLRQGLSPVGPPFQRGRVRGNSEYEVLTAVGDWSDFYRELAAALRTGSQPPVAAEDALTTLRILEAAEESTRSRQHVEVS